MRTNADLLKNKSETECEEQKASRKEQENKFRHHDFHGSEIVRIYCTVQSIAITFRGLGWAGSFSSSERQCFEEGKTWETENDAYYPSAKSFSSIISKQLFRCCNRTSLASLLPKLQIRTRKNNFHFPPLSSMSQSFKHSTFMWTWWKRKMEIYSKLKDTFSELNIPMENIIGYSSDTTNVKFGQHNSVSKLLKSKDEQVQIVKCFFYLIYLVSTQAALKIPKCVEDLRTDIYGHPHRSSKRQKVYNKFQTFFYA